MRRFTRLSLAAALVGMTIAPAFAQAPATPATPAQRPAVTHATPASPAHRPAAAATPSNPGGSVTQAQPAQRATPHGTTVQGANRAAPATPATPASPSQAPRATN